MRRQSLICPCNPFTSKTAELLTPKAESWCGALLKLVNRAAVARTPSGDDFESFLEALAADPECLPFLPCETIFESYGWPAWLYHLSAALAKFRYSNHHLACALIWVAAMVVYRYGGLVILLFPMRLSPTLQSLDVEL